MSANDDRLVRIEDKLDALAISVEHRVTKLESTAKAAGRLAGAVWGFGAGLVSSLIAAWLGKHL